jgi:hypothetical protein
MPKLRLEDYKPAEPEHNEVDWLFENRWITYDVLLLARAAIEKRDRDAYQARALPRLAAIDALSKRIDFSTSWQMTPEGERYSRLMREQCEDEAASGL